MIVKRKPVEFSTRTIREVGPGNIVEYKGEVYIVTDNYKLVKLTNGHEIEVAAGETLVLLLGEVQVSYYSVKAE